jgi:hypothetical protein
MAPRERAVGRRVASGDLNRWGSAPAGRGERPRAPAGDSMSWFANGGQHDGFAAINK